jgi:hypothetical protein
LEGQISIDIEKWKKYEKSLIIACSLKKHFGNDAIESDYDSNKNSVYYANAMGESSISILGDTGSFPHKDCLLDLVNDKLSLPSNTISI